MIQANYKVRSALIFLLFCSLYAIIIANLYSIQIKQQDFYANLGSKQYYVTVTQRPPRALILDRNSKPLALNKDALSAFIMPKMMKDPETLKPFLKAHYPKAFERLQEKPNAHFLFVKRNISQKEQKLITTRDIADIHLLKEPNRYYPVKAAGPVVGLTDIDNNGLFGIELTHDKLLAGKPITYTLEKDARSGHFYFDKQIKNEGHSGKPIRLTIDRDIQFLAYEAVKDAVQEHEAKSGAALVINPTNGDILAAVQFPTFDPHNTKNLDIELTKLRAITDAYELGSVIKAFLALAALQEGVVTPNEEIDCEGVRTTYINGMKVNTVFPNDNIPFAQVIQKSNNIGVVKVALRLQEKLYDHYRRLGFGVKTNLNFPGEQAGFVNPPEKWSKRSLLSLSFGYEIRANLLQLAQAFGVFANDGVMVPPRLIMGNSNPSIQFAAQTTQGRQDKQAHRLSGHSLGDGGKETNNQKVYSKDAIAQTRDILEQTASWTTRALRTVPELIVMGKTGTANLVIDGKYVPDRNVYTFAGIIEKGDYKRVIVTFVKESNKKGVLAARIAAPLFVRIAQQLLIHDKQV